MLLGHPLLFFYILFAIFASDEICLSMEHPENNEAYKGLKVNDGVEALGPVNPYLATMRRKKAAQLSVEDYVNGILRGDVTVLSRAVTLLESMLPEHQAPSERVCCQSNTHTTSIQSLAVCTCLLP